MSLILESCHEFDCELFVFCFVFEKETKWVIGPTFNLTCKLLLGKLQLLLMMMKEAVSQLFLLHPVLVQFVDGIRAHPSGVMRIRTFILPPLQKNRDKISNNDLG